MEIRKLLHEVSRIAEEALVRARKVKEEGEPAVETEVRRLDALKAEVSGLAHGSTRRMTLGQATVHLESTPDRALDTGVPSNKPEYRNHLNVPIQAM